MTTPPNDIITLLCQAAEAEHKEQYPMAFIQYKQAMMVSESQPHRQLLQSALRRVGEKMTSSTRRVDEEHIELILRYNKKRIRWRYDSRAVAQQLCDLALPTVKPHTPVLLLDFTQGFANARLTEQGAKVHTLVPHAIVERHLLFEYPVQKREQFRRYLYTDERLQVLSGERPSTEHFAYDYAVAIVSNEAHWKNTGIKEKQQLLLSMAANARCGAVFMLPNQSEYRQQQYGLKGDMGALGQGWPLDPWRKAPNSKTIRTKRYETRKGGNHLYGPNTDEFGQAEFKRVIDAYQAIAKNGYKPELYSDGFITGYFLSDGEDYRFIVTEGQHRLPALYQLGYSTLDVQITQSSWYPLSVVERAAVHDYDHVKKGIITAEQALACFDHHFQGEC